jgi:hypothetical protein
MQVEKRKKIKNDRMYSKGQLQQRRHQAWQSREQLVKRLKNQCELRFNPDISTRSRSLAYNTAKPENSYLELLQHKDESLTNARLQRQKEEQAECSFSPKVSKKSRQIASKIIREKDLFSSLYEESFERATKLQQESLRLSPQRERNPEAVDPAFLNRLVNSRKASEEQLMHQRHKLHELKDPETGQDFFKPVVSRGPLVPRNPNGLPVWSYLSLKVDSKPQVVSSSQNPSYVIPQSEKLLLKVKEARYHELFDQLNPNEHGHIGARDFIPEAVEPEAFRLIKPVLDELVELDETLDFYEFTEAMDNLVEILTPTNKAKLFKLTKQRHPAQVFPHKPQIIETASPKRTFMERQQQFLENRQRHWAEALERKG